MQTQIRQLPEPFKTIALEEAKTNWIGPHAPGITTEDLLDFDLEIAIGGFNSTLQGKKFWDFVVKCQYDKARKECPEAFDSVDKSYSLF